MALFYHPYAIIMLYLWNADVSRKNKSDDTKKCLI